MNVWRVIVSEQDGTGGGYEKDYLFSDYDLAHDFYVYIKSLYGTPFHPSVSQPPHYHEIKVHSCKFWSAK